MEGRIFWHSRHSFRRRSVGSSVRELRNDVCAVTTNVQSFLRSLVRVRPCVPKSSVGSNDNGQTDTTHTLRVQVVLQVNLTNRGMRKKDCNIMGPSFVYTHLKLHAQNDRPTDRPRSAKLRCTLALATTPNGCEATMPKKSFLRLTYASKRVKIRTII